MPDHKQESISSDSTIHRTDRISEQDEAKMKKDLLKVSLMFLTVTGCWRPQSWTSQYQCGLYNVYRIILIVILYSFAISQVMYIVVNVNNPKELVRILYVMMTMFLAFLKIIHVWIHRRSTADIIHTLAREPFLPKMIDEIKMRQKVDTMIRNFTLFCFALVGSTCASIIIGSAIGNLHREILTYRTWLPFNYTSSRLFFYAFAHQMISVPACGLINVAIDCFICSLLMHICCQIEILEHRLNKLHSWKMLRDCVRHHDLIFNYAVIVNERFAILIATQFTTSMLVVCSNFYQLGQSTLESDSDTSFLSLVLYTLCMMVQIFIWCYFGNEVKLKSLELSDRVFQTNWLAMNNSSKKALVMIMNRAMIPIEFTSAYIFSMNLESFVALLKTSYSVYTLLRNI